MTSGIDHIVIFVRDLECATRDFTRLGFTVLNGGRHDSTENALIIFEDETYIELLALKPGARRLFIRILGRIGILGRIAGRKTDMYWRLFRWISGYSGIVDWCVRTDHIKLDIESWASHGVDTIPPQKFSRKRPDGKVAEWYLGGAKTFEFPFLLEDITDKAVRVPLPHSTSHANGALGLHELIIRVQDPEKTKTQLSTLNIAQSANNSRMTIGSHSVHITQAFKEHPNISLHLSYSGSASRQLDTKLCHNADIWLVPQA